MAVSNGPADSNIDVLIIGAGPAGLMAAAWMAHCGTNETPKYSAAKQTGCSAAALRYLTASASPTEHGKNPGNDGVIRRSGRIPDTIVGLSRFQQIVLHQGRIERFFLDNIKKYSKDTIRVERGVVPESIELDRPSSEDNHAYPITVKLRQLSEEEATPEQQVTGSKVSDGIFRSNLVTDDDEDDLIRRTRSRGGLTETLHAKYVIGCDGARSWTRRALGFELEGESTDFIWGVLDIVPITDFPDIRMRCAIHSADSGSLMIIPREAGLVRLYIQLREVSPDATGRADRSKITPELIFGAAQKILHPYKIDYQYCDWWTAYQATRNFDAHQRVFLAGDAVHTHSPKAAQGMNVSMQDSYNLGWKIALVTKGIAKRSILSTYQSERHQVAQDLIDFDHRFSRLFSGRPAKDVMDAEGVSMEEFRRVFVKGNEFASGLSVNYGPSSLVAKTGYVNTHGDTSQVGEHAASLIAPEILEKKQGLATNLPVGMRFNSFKILNQADARPWHFQELLKADGRFRVVLFAGAILDPAQRVRVDRFCAALDAPTSFLRRITPAGAAIDSVVEVLTVHSSKREETELLRDFPEILHPFDKQRGWDYSKVYVDAESYHEGGGRAYESYGVDKQRGCVLAVRPDQHVGWLGELEDFDELHIYFDNCLVLASCNDGSRGRGN
ncbi:putative Phenol hydroxylase [Seiridium unicorne]|uniref:Phenol hydroxylase n=1 Tax=Seiridium unicorne TaxID=138068 RepID=A0ABR2UN16_9PEZI